MNRRHTLLGEAWCAINRRWWRRRHGQPFWRDDRVAQMLSVARFGCPRCGRNAIEERDRSRKDDPC